MQKTIWAWVVGLIAAVNRWAGYDSTKGRVALIAAGAGAAAGVGAALDHPLPLWLLAVWGGLATLLWRSMPTWPIYVIAKPALAANRPEARFLFLWAAGPAVAGTAACVPLLLPSEPALVVSVFFACYGATTLAGLIYRAYKARWPEGRANPAEYWTGAIWGGCLAIAVAASAQGSFAQTVVAAAGLVR
jgi:hypothetical protein